MPVWHDAYPEDLGETIVSQIREADMARWAVQARRLEPAVDEDHLNQAQLKQIGRWIEQRSEMVFDLRGQAGPSDSGLVWVTDPLPHESLCVSGGDLAGLLLPSIQAEPLNFWRLLWGNCGAILDLGLYPPSPGSFISSPHCEWFYLINFNTQEFVVGTGDYEPEEFLARRSKQDVQGRVRTIAAFPLEAISEDWVSLVETHAEAA
jgi:hypothetical protein